jgi:hypothetical protein
MFTVWELNIVGHCYQSKFIELFLLGMLYENVTLSIAVVIRYLKFPHPLRNYPEGGTVTQHKTKKY